MLAASCEPSPPRAPSSTRSAASARCWPSRTPWAWTRWASICRRACAGVPAPCASPRGWSVDSAPVIPDETPARPLRPTCARCRRPVPVCYCADIHPLPTRTRVVLLQHPRVRHVGGYTARMAHLALPNSTLRLGLDFSIDPVVTAELTASPDTYLLFPGPNAQDAASLPRDRPLTLVVLDGTWWQARKLYKLNPRLAGLPQVAFTPRHASAYRIRRQFVVFCLLFFVVLVVVLFLLLLPGQPLERLLDPFHAMVARQERYAVEVASARHRHTGPPRPRATAAGAADQAMAALAEMWPRLVCIYGEANAWPKRQRERPASEIVHWLAVRPATGETFEAVVAPRQPLAPAIAGRLGIDEQALRDGHSLHSWRQSWAEFLRPDDVPVTWGMFHVDLAAADGLPLPEPARIVDLRQQAHGRWRCCVCFVVVAVVVLVVC